MVFETQPDQINIKSEEEKLQKLLTEKKDPSVTLGALDAMAPEEKQQLELDNVNKHECMKNLKRCIDRMAELFGPQWEADRKTMPLFMQALNAEIKRADVSLNTRIFILKIAINQ